ncbi:uncharacterized protein MELLADRAFT_112348 [Melampsora larici-populina 98AG31]|uniref:RNase III domain-containing protein n=1 Tax=Melampsora larici-populina (strain 98AG31 / pathotype 3-4-7) TaxID=747676 RepID=F4S670_MELLP|nr:uncharacterized protein MELLADRAFT_112348 [Melampsora larici-populina 98AG31]EGF99893.1 hypothetical protein MELLADRAFT_112348 [Melampsora larici-populina 98AG31]
MTGYRAHNTSNPPLLPTCAANLDTGISSEPKSLNIQIRFFNEDLYTLGLISRKPLVLMQSDEKETHMSLSHQQVDLTIKAGEKLKWDKDKYSKIKNLERFCQFLMLIDKSYKLSKPDRFLVPFLKDGIDWNRVETPFEVCFSDRNRNGAITLGKVYGKYILESLTTPFRINFFSSIKSSKGNSRQGNFYNRYSVGSNIENKNWLPLRFWEISDRLVSYLRTIPAIDFEPDLRRMEILSQIQLFQIPGKNHNQEEYIELGRNFIRMVISLTLFHLGNDDVECLTNNRDKEMMNTNIKRLQGIFLEDRHQSKPIQSLVGAFYFHENKDYFKDVYGYFHKHMDRTLSLANQVGLSHMKNWEAKDWIRYCEIHHPRKHPFTRTDQEKLLENILRYTFDNIHLLRYALGQFGKDEFRRLEWIGDALLADWSSLVMKKIQLKSQRKLKVHTASTYLNANQTLWKWWVRWVDPTAQELPGSKKLEAIIGVIYIDCQCRADRRAESESPESRFHDVLLEMFEEEIQDVKSKSKYYERR